MFFRTRVNPPERRSEARRVMVLLALAATAATAPHLASATDRLDPRDRDTRAVVCDDAYRFANGAWLDSTPVPAGFTRWNRFTELSRLAETQRLRLLDALRGSPADSIDPLVNFLRSFDDEESLAASVDQALTALLPAVDQLQKSEQAAELLRELEARGVPVLFEVSRSARGATLQGHVLALDDPAFYLDGSDAARQILGNYRAYVEALLRAVGASNVESDSAWVLDFEIKLARAMRAQPDLHAHARELGQRMPHLGWPELVKALGGKAADRITLTQPALFESLDRLLLEAPAVQWRAWLRFRIVHALAPEADARLRAPYDALFASTLGAVEAVDDPALRSLRAVETWFRPELAQRITLEHVRPEQLLAATSMFDALRSTLVERIEARTDWPEAERGSLVEPLQSLRLAGLEPSDARDLSALRLSAQNRIGNVLAVRRWQRHRILRGLEAPAPAPIAPVVRLDAAHGTIELAPATLQPPLFAPDADASVRYGGLGVLLARELVRGSVVHAASARPDAPTAKAQFDALAASLAEAWTARSAGPPAIGGEALALDHAALALARAALQKSGHAAQTNVDGFDATQRFFLSWASLWRENRRPALAPGADIVATRANFALDAQAAFQDAFRCGIRNGGANADPVALRSWP